MPKKRHEDEPPEPPSDPLQRLVADRLAELGDSVRAAADRSHGLIAHSTLSRIASGSYRGRRIKGNTLAGLALALDLPESRIRQVAEEAVRPAQWLTVSKGFSRLDPEGQARAIAAMREIFADYERRQRERDEQERPFE